MFVFIALLGCYYCRGILGFKLIIIINAHELEYPHTLYKEEKYANMQGGMVRK